VRTIGVRRETLSSKTVSRYGEKQYIVSSEEKKGKIEKEIEREKRRREKKG
jgi:hypothetical protein